MILAQLFLGCTSPAVPAAAATEIFEGVTRPAPAPGPEMEWVFNQPAPEARVRTAFDLELIDVESSYRAFQAANAKLIGGVVMKKMSPAAALEAVKSLLKDPQTQATLATLRTRPELRTADGLQNLAAAALTTGRPLLALAGLWLAEERWPGDPQVRFNLANMLAQHGAVNEAEALLDELAARQRLPGHPFGITAQQGADYLRAYIRTRQGQKQDAEKLLKPIFGANPAFGEAALLFALVAESEEEARAAYIAGVWRRHPPARPPSTQPPADGGKTDEPRTEDSRNPPRRSRSRRTGLDAALLVDLSKGKPGELPAIRRPASLMDHAEFQKWYMETAPGVTAAVGPLLEARNAAMELCRQKDLPKPVRRRLMALERIIEPENSRLPELLALKRAADKALEDATNASGRISEELFPQVTEISARMDLNAAQKCALLTPLAEAAVAAMSSHYQAVDLATRRLHARWHQYATALGELTADPDFRTHLDAHIKASSLATYGMLLGYMAQSGAFAIYGCPAGSAEKNELGKPEGGALAKCSEEDAKKSAGVEVGTEIAGPVKPIDASVGIEATCDGISVEVGMELLGTLGLSLDAEFKNDGTCTLYLGPKVTVGVIAEYSHKGGVYVTVNNESFQNPIVDAGVRGVVKTSVKAGLSGASMTAGYTSTDARISLFAGPTGPAVNAGGPAIFK